MSVTFLSLEQFTAFEQARFEFSPGINVFIGANSTGKTHILKLIYTLIKTCETAHRNDIRSKKGKEGIVDLLRQKLDGVFKPDRIGRLVRRGRGRNRGIVKLKYDDRDLEITVTTQHRILLKYKELPNPKSALYLPAHEFLSLYEGFISAYINRETSFDETYYDLSLALDALPLRGPRLEEIKNLIEPLEEAISGKVLKENGRFYVRLPEGKFEAPLLAEGLRKIAGLIYLINNGSLTKKGILFWDEPAANLNPKLIVLLVDMLKALVANGVQVFLATHDYLLSQELSLLSEYPSDTSIKFFALHKPNRRAGVVVESGASLVDIEHNPILEEFAAHYDREAMLFSA